MELNLVAEGAKFMVIGMTVVYAFLILMVIAIQIQAKIVNRFFPEKKVVPQKPVANQNQKSINNDDSVVAAIMGAIKAFKNKHN